MKISVKLEGNYVSINYRDAENEMISKRVYHYGYDYYEEAASCSSIWKAVYRAVEEIGATLADIRNTAFWKELCTWRQEMDAVVSEKTRNIMVKAAKKEAHEKKLAAWNALRGADADGITVLQ